MTRRLDDQISRGFDAGNYANAYETENFNKALASLSMNRSKHYVAAFTLGFFGSCTTEEMGEHLEACQEAWALVGEQAKAIGIAVDEPLDLGDEHSEHEYHTRTDYGVMPDRDLFSRAFDARCPDGTFSFGNDPYVGNAALNESQLWRELETQSATWERGEHNDPCTCNASGEGCPSEDAGSWCSCVLGILGFEWI